MNLENCEFKLGMQIREPLWIGKVMLPNALSLAPMAGWSDEPFRKLVKEFGCGCVFSEMVSAEGLIRGDKKTLDLTRFHESEHPIGIQLFGHSPGSMAGAARIVEDSGADLVDINMGCPAKKIMRNTQGFALLENPVLAREIVKATVNAVSVPVTIKIRIGYAEPCEEIKSFVQECAGLGIAAVTVHARTKMQLFSGEPNLEFVRQLKRMVSIPVIGNGGIVDYSTAERFLTETNCDGLMIGTGALGNPWIYREILDEKPPMHPLNPQRIASLKHTVIHHLDLMISSFGEYLGITRFRKHFVKYSKKLPGAKELRRNILTVTNRDELVNLLDHFINSLTAIE